MSFSRMIEYLQVKNKGKKVSIKYVLVIINEYMYFMKINKIIIINLYLEKQMNLCFIIGKIVSEIEFKFIVNNKKYMSIAYFDIKLKNKSIIKVKAYNELADYCYSKLQKYDICAIQGYINSEMKIEVEKIVNK